MSKHTQGPWSWQTFGDGWKLIGHGGMRPFVLGCWGIRKSPGPPPPARFVVRDGATDRMVDFDPTHPDARLIAAAPELLDALLDMMRNSGTSEPAVRRAAYERCAAILATVQPEEKP